MKTVSETLVDFVFSQPKFQSETIDIVQKLIVDQVGIQIGCAQMAWSQSVYRSILKNPAHGNATVVHYGDKLSPEQAAFINAAFGHGQDFDDTHLKVTTHPGSVIIPVGFAVGEEVNANYQQVFDAILLGLEVMLRVAHSIAPDCLKKGIHTPPVAGPFGAAVTAGILMGLTKEQMVNALGIAGSFSGSVLEYTEAGGSVKRIHTAIPTTAGIRAANFAKEGLTGPKTIFEGKKGICKVFSNAGNPGKITDDLGRAYLVNTLSFKKYNCCYFNHAPLEGALGIVNSHKITPQDIQAIEIGLSAYAASHVGQIRRPKDELGAQFSVTFCTAYALLKGFPNLTSFTPEVLSDPAILSLEDKIHIHVDELATAEYPENWGANVKLHLEGGQAPIEARIRYPKGNPENAMSHAEIVEKYNANVGVVDPVYASALAILQDVNDTTSAKEVMRALTSQPRHMAAPRTKMQLFAEVINAGGIVAIPTATVYGLVCDASNPAALRRLRTICNSPARKPLTLIFDKQQAPSYGAIDKRQMDIINALMPSPTSLFFERDGNIFPDALCDSKYICLMWQDSEVKELHKMSGKVLAITSANKMGEQPAATLDRVIEYFGGDVDLYMKGGDNRCLTPSEQYDITQQPIKLLRKSAFTDESKIHRTLARLDLQ